MTYQGYFDLENYRGKETGAVYPFGLLRRRGYVDSRDVPGLLEIIEDTLPAFKAEA